MSEAVAGPGGPGGGPGGPGGGGPGGGGNFGGGNFNGASGESFNQAAPRRDDAARMSAQRDGQRDAQHYDARAPKGGEARQVDPRSFEGRAEEQRRAMDQNREGYRKTHLTPDERRDLKRQINEAGPEIYSSSPRR